ncbi:MAG: hypothetical protein ACD_57C00287G0001 [uncultured bacterium]|nr:MAG: hypothetical protein ACD_57C00287G0001 [uncultured bacterium]
MSDFLDGKLDNPEIKQRLLEFKYSSGFKPSLKLVDSIIQKFWFHDFYNSFISEEIYLNYLIKYLEEVRPTNFNRFNFYQYFFSKIANSKKDRVVLQAIALDFEKRQLDALSEEEYKKLLDTLGVKSNKFNVAWMEKNHLGKFGEREKQRLFILEHHTLTEFLVAEYLLNQNSLITEFQKLAVLDQEGITALKPSWSGVLRFLLETGKAQSVFEWLIMFLDKNKEGIDDNLSEIITCSDLVLSSKLHKKTFDLIYNSYFERLAWLPVWTRTRLSKFVDAGSYKKLRDDDIKKHQNQTATYIRRGNAIAIIEGLLESKSQLVSKKEGEFWKKTIMDFANGPDDGGNGVLQRTCLSALAYFKDEKVIVSVAKSCFDNTRDSLVRDEFIQLCMASAPNSKIAIDYFVKGIKTGHDIYPRHGLYLIREAKSIEYLLKNVSEDDNFWISFLKHESIFDKESGDMQLINNIKKVLSETTLNLLKKIVFKIFLIPNLYEEEKSGFVKNVVRLIESKTPDFIFEILNEIDSQQDDTKSLHLFFDYEEILATLLTPDNLTAYFDKAKKIPSGHASSPIYIAKRINGAIGQAVYEKAVKLKKVEPVDEKAAKAYWDKQQNKRKQDILKNFRKQLNPSPGKYSPNVFEYYLHNKKDLDIYFESARGKKYKKRLIELALDSNLAKINPQDIKVSIPDKNVKQFTWSSVASYYGNVLSIVKTFVPQEIKKYRQQIIDFIPYAYSDDMGLIMELIEKLDDRELVFVNKVMIDKNDDRRYLIPGSYIYLVNHYAKKGCKLPSALPVLKSFIGDEYLPDYEQRSAIEALPSFINQTDKEVKKLLQGLFTNEEAGGQKSALAQAANEVLIKVYKDEGAIKWRFNQIKNPIKFDRRTIEGIAHSVGAEELELDYLAFARPLIELKDERFLDRFFGLLDYSFKLLEGVGPSQKQNEYWEYINYIWRIVIGFVDNLKEEGSFIPLLAIEAWSKKYANSSNSNWLMARIKQLKNVYISYIRPFDRLTDSIEPLRKSSEPAAQIAHFLFKAQIVETKLKFLIEGINYFLELATKDYPIYRKAEIRKFRESNYTLGQLKNELNKYQSRTIEKLDSKLSKFHDKRNEFTHQLFLQKKNINDLAIEASQYTKSAEESLSLIQNVWKEILNIK